MRSPAKAVQIPERELEAATRAVAQKAAEFKDQYGLKEKLLSVDLQPHSQPVLEVLTAASAEALLSLLHLVPHGVAKMSHAVEGGACRVFARLLTDSLQSQSPTSLQ